MPSAKFILSGKVQGVFFRSSTRTRALELGLRGYAKNLQTGDVEVVAIGSHEALDELERWLLIGPPLARVERVVKSEVGDDNVRGFSIY